MGKKLKIPPAVVERLPKYYRYLTNLQANKIDRVSSCKLAEMMEITASQVRQDLRCLGELGQHGYGYKVFKLMGAISEALGVNKEQNVIIIGAGRMGRALTSYGKLSKWGFNILGIFDKDKSVVGNVIDELVVEDISLLEKFIKNNKIDIGILCISNDEGQMMGEKLISLGIKAIWNFSPVDLKFSKDVVVENVHLFESLMILSYKHRQKKIINEIAEKILNK